MRNAFLIGCLVGLVMCQPAPVFAVVASGGGGTTLTDSASLRSALSDETGTGVAVFGTSPTFTTSIQVGTSNASTTGAIRLPNGLTTSSISARNAGNSADLNMIQLNSSNEVLVGSSSSTTWISGLWSMNAGTGILSTGGAYAISINNANWYGDASDTWSMRRTTNGQTVQIFNTYTSSTSNELYQNRWSGNVCYTGTKAGSAGGSNRLEVHHGGEEKALTESSATEVVQVQIASGVTAASITGGVLHYSIIAGDGTDLQCRTGSVNFSAVNKSGTETVALGTIINESIAASSGTLTVTWDTDTAATNAVTFRANAVSSLSQTFLTCRYRLELFGPQMTAVPVP